MKRNPLLWGLVALLCLSALATVLLATRYFFGVAELQKLQEQSVELNTTLNAAQALANESILYSKRNPAITSVLHRFKTPEPGAAPLLPPSQAPSLTPTTINQ